MKEYIKTQTEREVDGQLDRQINTNIKQLNKQRQIKDGKKIGCIKKHRENKGKK